MPQSDDNERNLTAAQRKAMEEEDAAFRGSRRWRAFVADPTLLDRIPFVQLREAAWLENRPYMMVYARLKRERRTMQKKPQGRIYVAIEDVVVRRRFPADQGGAEGRARASVEEDPSGRDVPIGLGRTPAPRAAGMRRTTTPVVLNDPLIRSALVARLRSEGRLLMHEVDIAWSSSRADVLTLDDELCGYEIKSDRDSFARLSDQMTSYRHIFDRVFIVTTERHLAKALSVRPSGVGVLVASGLPVEFRLVHPAGRNRSQRIDMLIDLLDHREVRVLARSLGLRGYSGLGKYETIERVLRSVPGPACRAGVLDILRNRPNWHRAQSIAS